MAVLFKSQVCYRIQDPADGREYAMKDCWVADVKRFHEVDVLKRVKGIPNVVQLVDHWDVLFSGEPDCTARIRDRYEDRPDKKFINSSRKELICAFRNFVVAHEMMIKQRVLHGDLSPNNFIIHEGIGYFIEFSTTASIMKEGETFTISVWYWNCAIYFYAHFENNVKERRHHQEVKVDANTNSIAQLKLVEHNPSDDLESLFYIFFEFVSKYGGAHGAVAKTWDKTTMPWADAYENLGIASSLLATFLAKKGAMSESDVLMDSVSDYFAEFRPIINEWRDQIYCMESNPNGVVHDDIFQMLVKFISNLDNEEPAPLPSPEASPDLEATTRRSSRPNCGVGGHAAQLQRVGEMVAAPTKKRPKGDDLQISSSDENPMAPSQLQKVKTNPPAKPSSTSKNKQNKHRITGSSQHPQAPTSRLNLYVARSSERFGFKEPQSNGREKAREGQPMQKEAQSSGRKTVERNMGHGRQKDRQDTDEDRESLLSSHERDESEHDNADRDFDSNTQIDRDVGQHTVSCMVM
ncbi:hypothetical protein DEU56DRAFT_946284 [Suillus clintonianus]|uniref:uncharacterized protein n=1 Tax=Suillus clintonianus TaxID=1904413 RepID=UPI001B87D4DD|nr:uncharacterized protein DEU56DRAFT_946284 [Suillus clintonianus]KAG2136998.1 hypothetical protein DEU56DRAFT_946284 [Suillus clintonianus]